MTIEQIYFKSFSSHDQYRNRSELPFTHYTIASISGIRAFWNQFSQKSPYLNSVQWTLKTKFFHSDTIPRLEKFESVFRRKWLIYIYLSKWTILSCSWTIPMHDPKQFNHVQYLHFFDKHLLALWIAQIHVR